jgi:putative transposase
MIEIKPVFGTFKVILTYENEHKKETKTININSTDVISIDLGVNNLMTIYNPNGNQYIISGGPLKSLNYYISKKISKHQRLKDDYYINKYQKIREDKINDYFNRIVKWLTTEYSSEKLIIIIGYNKGWKDKSNMGKKSNLIFNKIPFMKLINKIKMKFNVLLTEESYTSKCDGLALEDLSKQESYIGKRINRGLFKSSTEKIINADLNGAINIMRKQIKLTKITGYRLMSPKRIQIYSMMFNPVDNVH